jgi:hypothetical protein
LLYVFIERAEEHVQMLALIDSVVRGEDGGAAIDYIAMEAEEFPLPGTVAARGIGCTCPLSTPESGTDEAPFILDIQCPWHGKRAFEEHMKGARH